MKFFFLFFSGCRCFDMSVKPLFTHDDKELHCPDRELIHPCTTELRKFLKDKDQSYRQVSYDCAQTVYETTDDFQIVKNMTHLLLDLDTSVHFFDRELEKDRDFFDLGLKFGNKLMNHEECMIEFDEKEELECRCPHLYAKIIMLKLKNYGLRGEASKMFDDLKKFEWNGKKRQYKAGDAYAWTTVDQTPQMYIRGLEAMPVIPESRRKDLPIWDALEKSYPDILEEVEAAYGKANSTIIDDAYRFLFQNGKWNQIVLFHGKNYTEACSEFPRTCAMLKEVLPQTPQY